MEDKLQLLSEKIEQVIARCEDLKKENSNLKQENDSLKSSLIKVQKDYDDLKMSSTDQSETVKAKLTGILDRLDQLEQMSF